MENIQEPGAKVQEPTQEPGAKVQEPPEPQPSLGWRAALEKDLQDHPLVKDKTKPSEFVREALKWAETAQKVSSDKVIEVPDEKATDEEKAKFYKAIGRPESPDEYELTDNEFFPEDLTSQFKKVAYDAGLNKGQAKSVVGLINRYLSQMAEQSKLNEEKAKQDQLLQLKEEWGDQFEENRTRVGKLALKLFNDMPDFLKWAKDTGFYDSVPFNKMIHTIAEKVGEDTLIEGSLRNTTSVDDVGYSFPNTPGMT